MMFHFQIWELKYNLYLQYTLKSYILYKNCGSFINIPSKLHRTVKYPIEMCETILSYTLYLLERSGFRLHYPISKAKIVLK